MSNRPAVKSAFANLRPSIVREPVRTSIAPEDESKLLEKPASEADKLPVSQAMDPTMAVAPSTHGSAIQNVPLLKKKRKEILVPLTFRIPQGLKERLNEVAKKHEVNQTDLINEAIQLNLQRYS